MPPRKKKTLTHAEASDAREYFEEEVFEENAGNTDPVLGEATRWKKGRSPNPMGRPKAPDDLDELLLFTLRQKGRHRALAEKLVQIAVTGNLDAIKYIYDRAKGRPRQAVITSHDEEDPLVRMMRQVIDDNRALEGRSIPVLQSGPIIEAEVRAYPSEGAGS
jgi:hypothetical protein